jgi:uncharacterized protein (DUF2252 family)
MFSPDPLVTADRQMARDREATRAYPSLLAHKVERMQQSPLSYLRGTAPLYYELLEEHPELAAGPAGEGWLVGDAHLENFGAFRADVHGSESVVFDVNDFDEAVIGPFRWDVVRLLTSMILAGRGLGSSGKQSVLQCNAILEGYVAALFGHAPPPAAPPSVQRLLDKVEQRTHKNLLDHRTERVGNARRFVRGARYQELGPELVAKAHAAFARYVERLDPNKLLDRAHFEIEDVAFRVAGCGSLGVLRIAVLTSGKGQPDSRWIFDMKEEGVPSAQRLVGAFDGSPAERVLTATRACLVHPPRMVGTSELDDKTLFVRRLLPQEDKLDQTQLGADELPTLARHLGALLGLVHGRGAQSVPAEPWSATEQAALTEHAIVIAGLHEAAYLALCKSG